MTPEAPTTIEAPPPVRDLDWSPERARAFGDGVLDIWQELLERLPRLPVGTTRSADDVAEAVTMPIPDKPLADAEIIEYLRRLTFDWSMYPGHSGFMAYISGAGTVPGAAADLLAAALNQNLGAWRLSPAGTTIELHLMQSFAQRFGLPESAGGIFTSGGAMAAFTALKTARDAKAGIHVRREGIAGSAPLTAYGSTEVHDVNSRAADMLGLGSDAIRAVPVDDALQMRVDLLRRAVEADLAAGNQPFAVVATAGTVGTGAIDPLEEIADLCREFDLWLHVDGAYGGIAALVPAFRPQFAGIERADSIAFDPHKWLYTPHSGGALVVANARHLEDSFAVHATYTVEDKELTGRGIDLFEMGPQFSRGFQGLKVWVSLLAHGWDAYSRRIAHDVELARYLHDLAGQRPEFEVLDPQSLSIACFRFVPPGLRPGTDRDEYLNALNERLMAEIQLDGRVFPSNAVVDDRFWLRSCIVNFRTEAEDVEALLGTAATLGARIDRELRPETSR